MKNNLFGAFGTAAAVTILTFSIPSSANAAEMVNMNAVSQSATVELESGNQNGTSGSVSYVDESTIVWELADDVKFNESDLTVTQNGVTEQLPTTATDVNGQPVAIEYRQTDDGVQIQTVAMFQTRGIGQCILGVGGGIIGGGTAGGLGGAAVGTVTLPVVGTVSAGLVGLIGGAVGGGMTGAATSCF